jgi:hypothetical protein
MAMASASGNLFRVSHLNKGYINMVRKNASKMGERISAAYTINKKNTANPITSMERLTVNGSVCTAFNNNAVIHMPACYIKFMAQALRMVA